MTTFHDDLKAAKYIPKFSFGPRITKAMRGVKMKSGPYPDDLDVEDVMVPGLDGGPSVRLRLYTPKGISHATPALFWIHGGGFVSGAPEQDEATNIRFARELGMTVAAVQYRLAPDNTAPDALSDVYGALLWLFAHAEERGIDPERIAVGGASAGGGLAAGLTLYAHDLGVVTPAFQLLVYPMLDDRTVLRKDLRIKDVRMWTPGSNRFGWTSYLGQEPGGDGVSDYAAPARRENLGGLPPAWIGVGTLDLFYDEDIEYYQRLNDAGVHCDLDIVAGAFHGFDAVFRKAAVSKAFWDHQARALRRALFN